MLSTTLLISCVKNAFANEKICNPSGDGRIGIYSYHLNEAAEVTYKINGFYNQAALEKIYDLLRSPDGKTAPISIKLIEIIDDIQDHFGARVVEVISGFRSRNYNRRLKEEGRRVAGESLHTKGDAIDIHIDEVTEEALRDYAQGLFCGGVGFYPDYDFVHIDIGPLRRWGKGGGKRTLVGMENNKTPYETITDKNDYFVGEDINIVIKNTSQGAARSEGCASIEMFDGGKWLSLGLVRLDTAGGMLGAGESAKAKIAIHPKMCKTNKKTYLPYGRFRLNIEFSAGGKRFKALSNEFYIKKDCPNISYGSSGDLSAPVKIGLG